MKIDWIWYELKVVMVGQK